MGQEDPLEKGIGNQFQYSCLEKPMDGGAWQATVHGVANRQTQLTTNTRTHEIFHQTEVLNLEYSNL